MVRRGEWGATTGRRGRLRYAFWLVEEDDLMNVDGFGG